MKAAIFAYSRKGCATAEKIAACFEGWELRLFAPARLEAENFALIPKSGRDFYGEQFAWADAMIFVGSCGIAVREIAPHVRDKCTDPAVVSVDELAAFVVPLLSGHIGGANELARKLAAYMNATPVITTATDINGRFSVDAWASRKGFVIGNIKTAKKISAAVLEKDVPLFSEFPISSSLPDGIVMRDSGEEGIYVGVKQEKPFNETLQIIPPVLHLGVGCRKGTSADMIRKTVTCVLEENRIDKRAIRQVASIKLKSSEQGLLEFCRENRWPVLFYSGQELLSVEGDFTVSEFVRSVTGVENVCERSAMVGADRLLVRKTAGNGVTVAIAIEKLEVDFE